jgi:methylmalonyl-CoA mutase
MKNYEELFQDFDALEYQQWKESAIKTIKGADFDKKLTWKTQENILVQPYYAESRAQLSDVALIPQDIHKPWDIIEPIMVKDIKSANTQSLEALNNGATAIEFDLKNLPSFNMQDFQELSDGINTEIAPIFLLNTCFEINQKNVYFNPVNGYQFKQDGANIIQEIAFTLSLLNDNLASYKSNQNIWLRISTGSNYFMEIAKFQVLRNLCNTILEQYNISSEKLYIQAISWVLNKSTIDNYTNMLRNTTEAMSSVIGGCDGISVLPHDALMEESKEMGKRIARNISLVLQHESYFGTSPNPVAGTYYIEELSQELTEKSWNLFLEIEELGGYQKAFESGIIEKAIKENRDKQQQQINNRSTVLVGVNDFPNLEEKEIQTKENTDIERWSGSFENIRKKVSERKQPIKAVALFENNHKMSALRYAYSVNFWSCVGISLSKLQGKEIEEQILSLKNTDYDMLIICSSNESWNAIVEKLKTSLSKKGLWIIAGNTKDGLDEQYAQTINHSFYAGIDMIDFIENILKEI